MKFELNEFYWQANIALPSWSDFTAGNTTLLTFAPEGRDKSPMRADEIALTTWVKDNYKMQKHLLLNAILDAYPEFRHQFFEDYNIKENEDYLPRVTSVNGLSKVIALEEIFVHQISKDGLPYVGYQFSCDWDKEHGLGVLMHQKRVIEIGGADCAFTLWVAERDRDS